MLKKRPDGNHELKVYVFYWSNTRLGVTDKKGTTVYFPEKKMVIATNPEEARDIFKSREKRLKDRLRKELKGHRPSKYIKKLIGNVFHKDGLSMREFPLRKGLTV